MPRCPNPRCQTDYPAGSTQCTNLFCRCLLPEAVVAGRYRIETLIGLGGMGAVYRVSDTFEMEQAALKVLTLTNASMDQATAVERFRREARYAHQLRHKNIVPVLNFGQDGDLLYLVMPLVTGGTLKALLKGEKPLPTQQALRYLKDLGTAIDAVHAHPQKIIHRDIKPSNLLVHQDDGRLVLADFGIARAMEQEKPLTQRGWSLGTEHYIAPEQEHGQAQPSSDIYAMGVVAYQMFTGLLPFLAVVRSRATELPVPSKLNPTLPPTIDPIIMRAMDIDPAKRHRSAGAFVRALEEAFADDLTIADDDPANAPTIVATSNANVIVRALIPENPCARCGRENRSSSRFCRHCGHSLDETSPLVTEVCQVGYVSEAGQQAQDNEDMLLVIQGLCVTLAPPPRPFSIFGVADGLRGTQGKPAGGHEASRLAIETVADVLLPLIATAPQSSTSRPTPGSSALTPVSNRPNRTLQNKLPDDMMLEQWLRNAVRQANQVIYHCNADYDTTMASTLTVGLIYKRRFYATNVGDSRAYHYSVSKGSLRRITNDHTMAANLVEADLLRPDEVYESAKRNQHYRYLGHTYNIAVDLFQQEVEPDDLLLLCTDGLWHMLRDERIKELLALGGDTQRLANILVEAANDAGGEGNVSAIVVRVQ